MDRNTITVKNVNKSFGKTLVLQNINVQFVANKIYGLVGRNGSGKSVFLKCISGFISPTSGEIYIGDQKIGKDIDFPNRLGFIIETPSFLPSLSGIKNLQYLASINRLIDRKQIEKYIELVGLNPDEKKHVSKYSLGMIQRLGIAQALMEDPKILLLDEPMNGLDNKGVEDIRKLLLDFKSESKIIILASHNREDISVLCDEVYEMDQGCLYRKCIKMQGNNS